MSMKFVVLIFPMFLASLPLAFAQEASGGAAASSTIAITPSVAAPSQGVAEVVPPPREAEKAGSSISISLPPPAPSSPASDFKVSGDMRVRAGTVKEASDDERSLEQLRVRLGLRAKVNDEAAVVLRLATGASSISTNQTMGDAKDPGMAPRAFGLDLAYIDWQVASPLRVWVGRTANPFWSPGKVQTVFDSDLTFAGLAAVFEKSVGSVKIFSNFGSSMISENYSAPSDDVDTGLAGGQLGLTVKALGTWTLHFGAYHFLNIQGRPVNSVERDARIDEYSNPYDRYRGNTVYPNDPLLPADKRKYYFQSNYVLSEVGLEWRTKIDAVEPLVFIDVVQNDQTTLGRSAIEAGMQVKWGRLSLAYAYAFKEGDSVVGAFADSDMNGGGTANRGTRMMASYQLSDQSQIMLTDFRGTRGIGSVEREFNATQLDAVVSF